MFRSTLQTLDPDPYQNLRAGAMVLEADSFGDKVLRLADGTIFKLFRRKRLFSSALIYPYARRFVDNIQRLDALGIACPEIIAAYHVTHIARDAVHYHPLAGETLRRIVAGKNLPPPPPAITPGLPDNWAVSSPVCTKRASIFAPCILVTWC